jgi:hypothetical protein
MVMVESALGTGIMCTIGRKGFSPDRLEAFTYRGLPIVEIVDRVRGNVIRIPGMADRRKS